MNNLHTLHIDKTSSRTAALKIIKETLDSHPWVVLVDLIDVTFPLHRDFFLVLSRKFPKDRFILRLKHEKTVALAQSLGIQSEVAWLQAEFERAHSTWNLATHNMSMWEYFLYEIRRGWLWIKFVLFDRKKQENKLPHFKKNNFQTVLIISGLISSLVLLLFIFHFAISKTIITITPEIMVRPVTANILYRLEWATGSVLDTRSTINLKKVELPVETEMKFKVSAIDAASAQNARGLVTIYNELNVAQELRPQTRFVTADGVVFRTTSWAKIPASRSLNGVTEMGILEVEVVADINDESGRLIGGRWNIASGTDLSIPGLKFNRDRVYAKAKDNFTGGADPSVHIVTQEEVDSFQNTINEKIQKEAREALNQKLASDKNTTGQDYALLVVDTVAFTGTTFEIASGQKIGDTADEIDMKAKTTITATVMDKKATVEYLTQIFRENLLRGTNKELAIHEDTLRVSNIVSRNENDTEIKATLEMNTSTTYDLENVANELTKRLKILIAGIPEEEAKKQLIEQWYVKDVTIQNYPFWIGNISSNVDNIEFYIKN